MGVREFMLESWAVIPVERQSMHKGIFPMRFFGRLLVVCSIGLVALSGCSEKTQQETKEALQSAGEDTKENMKKAADAIEEGAQNVQEKLGGDDEPADTTPPAEPAETTEPVNPAAK
jgi:hypothetical protein